MQQTSQTPTLLGRYRVLETNTQGGFGTVSVCWDTRLQRRVAIKRMPLRLDDNSPTAASTLEEALSEARTSSLLTHPNIVRMYDFETDARYSYLVMEYVDGLNLAELLARVEDGVLTYDECAQVVDCVASALDFAHENGVLHLDIKPANIMVDRTGTVKLGDFGMATLASAAGYGDARGGTVGYMPPEQIVGDYVDERTDVFSLAVVVWQALTGRCPYEAPTPEQSLKLIEHGPSPALSRIEPELAGVAEETLLRALSPAAADRMASVETFARDLVRALGDPQDGADSLADLLTQAETSEADASVPEWGGEKIPLTVRFPWLGGLVTRLLSAACAAWLAYQTIPAIIAQSSRALVFGTVGVAAASAAWPPLSGLFAILLVGTALITQVAHLAFPLTVAVGIIGFLWWATVGHASHLANASILLPLCLGSPLAGLGLAGYALRPAPAFFTGALSYAVSIFFSCLQAASYNADLCVDALLALDPLRTALITCGAGLAALVCSLCARRGHTILAVFGQILVIPIMFGVYALCAHMENASIATTVDLSTLAVALSLGATLCIAIVLTGACAADQKGDEQA